MNPDQPPFPYAHPEAKKLLGGQPAKTPGQVACDAFYENVPRADAWERAAAAVLATVQPRKVTAEDVVAVWKEAGERCVIAEYAAKALNTLLEQRQPTQPATVSISPSLIQSREEQKAASMVPLTGAQLAWDELDRERTSTASGLPERTPEGAAPLVPSSHVSKLEKELSETKERAALYNKDMDNVRRQRDGLVEKLRAVEAEMATWETAANENHARYVTKDTQCKQLQSELARLKQSPAGRLTVGAIFEAFKESRAFKNCNFSVQDVRDLLPHLNARLTSPWRDAINDPPTHVYSVIGHITKGPLVLESGDSMMDVISYVPDFKCWMQSVNGEDKKVEVDLWMDIPDLPPIPGKVEDVAYNAWLREHCFSHEYAEAHNELCTKLFATDMAERQAARGRDAS